MNDHGSDLKHLCGKFLDQYFDPGDPLPALTQLIVGRLPKATADEIEDALHSLWRLTRHLTRETCWSQVMWELHQEGKLSGEIAVREEIAGWYFGDTTDSGAAQQEEGKLERRRQPERRKHATEPPPVPATIDEYVRSYYPEGDPVSLALPKVESYDDVDGVERYWYLYRDIEGEWSLYQFHVLAALARAFAVRVGDSDEFWAVFGPIQDALAYDHPTGYGEAIEAARAAFVVERVRANRADLYDHWLILCADDDEDERREAVERMIDYVRDAGAAECEEFFHGLDFSPLVPFGNLVEVDWPNADRLWQTITKKEDLSLWLYGRAGFYYWHSSPFHYGPSLALAALGAASERILWMAWHGMPPFLAFWAAAREAAGEGGWEFAAHCLSRALLDIALYARALDEEGMKMVEEFRFDLRFVGELLLRSREQIEAGRVPLRRCVALAVEMCSERFDEWSDLRRALRDLARRLNIQAAEEPTALRRCLGDKLVRRLENGSWDGLMAAELAWERRDGVSMASRYRNAVEYEWQKKIGDLMAGAGATWEDRRDLGRMMEWLRRCVEGTVAGDRRRLERELGESSQLLRVEFLKASLRVNRQLNVIRHGAGERELPLCEEVRKSLLERGMLRSWLEAVQMGDT